MTAKLVPTAEAFRTILRAKYPEREDLLQINSYQWFHNRQRTDRSIFGGVAVRIEEDRPAYEALAVLRDGIVRGKIRLHGIWKTEQPADINPIHAEQGDLDVFAGTLTFEHSDVFRTKQKYTNVHVYADDLALGDVARAPSVPPTRYPGDAALLEEGRRMMDSGMQKRAIARTLATRAEGDGTFESKVDRLRKAL